MSDALSFLLRLDPHTVERIDAYTRTLSPKPKIAKFSRSAVIRLLIENALENVEASPKPRRVKEEI